MSLIIIIAAWFGISVLVAVIASLFLRGCGSEAQVSAALDAKTPMLYEVDQTLR